MGKNKKKRSHAQYALDHPNGTQKPNVEGVASTLAHIKNTKSTTKDSKSGDRDSSDQWQKVEQQSKRPKNSGEKGDNRPALTIAGLHTIRNTLYIQDLQSLVLHCLADGVSPQWLSVRHHSQVKKAVVLLVPGLERDMFDGQIKLEKLLSNDNDNDNDNEILSDLAITPGNNQADMTASCRNAEPARGPDDYLPKPLVADRLPEPLQPLVSVFEHLFPVRTPGDEKYSRVHSPLHAMLNAPIPKSLEQKKAEKAIKGPKPFQEGKAFGDIQPTPITTFVTSKEDLQENEYTLHQACFPTRDEKDDSMSRRGDVKETEEFGWKDTYVLSMEDGEVPDGEIQKGSLTAGRIVLAMDCEMCKVEGDEMALTRISIVSWDGSVVMDELVKPGKPIIDYLTPYSGITQAKLESVTTTLSDIQNRLLEILTARTILIGHSLNSDLTALKMTHPFIVDTSILYPHPRGPPLKSSLKWLAKKYLNREIQKGHGTLGHDSIEDATACLDLVRIKCEKGVRWGARESNEEPIFKRLSRTPKSGSSLPSDGKVGAIIDKNSACSERHWGKMASVYIRCDTDQEVVEGVKRAVLGDPDGAIVPGGGVDLTWARLRELEALRGWSNESRLSPNAATENSQSASPATSAPKNPSTAALSAAVSRTVQNVLSIHAFLPPCTLLVVYSGTGDPREMYRLQEMQRTFKKEYATKKWDELSVRWTDVEEQAQKAACRKARQGMGLVVVT